MKYVFWISILIGFFSVQTFAGDRGSGGGDEVALQFHEAFNQAAGAITKDAQLEKLFSVVSAENVADHASVVTVDDILKTNLGNGLIQYSIAVNYPQSGQIQINRARWLKIGNPVFKQAIALHEVLSLMHIEATGRYPISSRYLEKFDLSQKQFEDTFYSKGYDYSGEWSGDCNYFVNLGRNEKHLSATVTIKQSRTDWEMLFKSPLDTYKISGYMQNFGYYFAVYSKDPRETNGTPGFSERGDVNGKYFTYEKYDLGSNERIGVQMFQPGYDTDFSSQNFNHVVFYFKHDFVKNGRLSNYWYYCELNR